jgi:uncharacterized SAM-binding protein YcdF (DUF218 family)
MNTDKHGKFKLPALVFLVFVLLGGAAALYVPRFLVYADKPVKADAIIVFEGDESRDKEAHQLRNEGYAGFILIPAYFQVIAPNYPLPKVDEAPKKISGSEDLENYPRFYENTHVEMLRAKKMMNSLGLKSAIMVSSPYHMERIRMIARRIFGEQARLFTYVPTRYDREPADLRSMRRADWMFIASEIIKICWFRVYSPFVDNNSSHRTIIR